MRVVKAYFHFFVVRVEELIAATEKRIEATHRSNLAVCLDSCLSKFQIFTLLSYSQSSALVAKVRHLQHLFQLLDGRIKVHLDALSGSTLVKALTYQDGN